jgi:hypothetical protein
LGVGTATVRQAAGAAPPDVAVLGLWLVPVVVAVVVVVLVVRASNAPGRRAGGVRLQRPPRRTPPTRRAVAPDDDPEFLAELERRARRDDGTKNA